MPTFRDDKKLIWILLSLTAVLLLILMLNYLWKTISKEGQQLKVRRTIEMRIIPLVKSKHFGFIQSGSLIYNQNYINAHFSYPYKMDIDFKLKQLSRHLQRYELEVKNTQKDGSSEVVFRIYSKGEKAAQFHLKRAVKIQEDKKKVKEYTAFMAIILDDFGYNFNETSRGFLAIKEPLNISVIPGHKYSQKIAASALENGHDVMIHMPMEPFDYMGGEEEYILRIGMDSDEVKRRIQKAIVNLPNARAMNNHMGSRATSDPDIMNSLAASLREEKILFVDSYTYAGSMVEDVFLPWGLSPLKRDIFLDNEADVDYIKEQIRRAIRIARKTGSVIAIGHVRSATLTALRSMLDEIEKNGIRLVRITEFEKFRHGAA